MSDILDYLYILSRNYDLRKYEVNKPVLSSTGFYLCKLLIPHMSTKYGFSEMKMRRKIKEHIRTIVKSCNASEPFYENNVVKLRIFHSSLELSEEEKELINQDKIASSKYIEFSHREPKIVYCDCHRNVQKKY